MSLNAALLIHFDGSLHNRAENELDDIDLSKGVIGLRKLTKAPLFSKSHESNQNQFIIDMVVSVMPLAGIL